ncbi:MAG: XRE family transcriptional regulator [Pedobacter sp.]|nr:MAG: XRE family transcriptional regulator [Pedobacter sp.]
MVAKDDLAAFGEKLKDMRIAKKLSLQKFADEADLAKSTVHRIEKGDLNFSYTILLSLAKALKISPAEFFDK